MFLIFRLNLAEQNVINDILETEQAMELTLFFYF